MSWTKKTKIEQGTDRGRILTPDRSRILVGSGEDKVLIYQILATFWDLKSKLASASYSLKTKITP